jgi:hypothetical protein
VTQLRVDGRRFNKKSGSGLASPWRAVLLAVGVVAGFTASDRRASGQILEFKVDAAQSTLNLVPAQFSGSTVVSGTKLTNTIGVIQQFAGSLATRLSGTLYGTLSGNVLSLNSQSFVVATASPAAPFQPPSSLTGSPGGVDNFGGLAVRSNGSTTSLDSTLAIRNIKASVAGGNLTVNSAPSNLRVSVSDGLIDLMDPPFENEPPDYYYYEISKLFDPAPIQSTSTQQVTGGFTGTIRVPYSLSYPFDGGGRVDLAGVVVATRVGLPAIMGDFDGNRVVNSADLTQWKGDFGLNADSNADGDGDSDGADFLIWQRKLGATSSVPASAPVPEPAGALLAGMTLLGLAVRRRT